MNAKKKFEAQVRDPKVKPRMQDTNHHHHFIATVGGGGGGGGVL